MGGATWFLRVLFLALLVYLCACFLLSKVYKQKFDFLIFFFCILCASLGFVFHLSDFNIGGCGTALSVIAFLEIGRRLNSESLVRWMKRCSSLKLIGICFFMFAVLVLLGMYESVLLNENSYKCVITMILCGCVGWLLLYLLAYMICKTFLETRMILAYVGRNTIPILCLHFLSFKVISSIQVLIYKSDVCNIASFPVYLRTDLWWIADTIVGVILPLVLNEIHVKFKSVCLKAIKR